MSKIAVVAVAATHSSRTRTTRDRRPIRRCRRVGQARGGHDRAGLGRAPDPRERPAGRVHPAPVGAVTGGAASRAARLLRRGHPGRHRLHVPARAAERIPEARHRQARRHRHHPDAGGQGRPRVREAEQADRLVHGPGDGSRAPEGRRLECRGGRGARLAAGRAVATPRQDRRVRGDRLAPPGGLHRGGVRRRRHPRHREGRRPGGHRGRDRQGLRCLDPRAGPEGDLS